MSILSLIREMKEKVSIVIPCYNDHQFVEEAVNSANEQTYVNKELILIDDGSDSQTKKILKKLQSKVDLMLVTENNGLATARNIGIENSKGKYILVWDSDDYFEESFCEKAVSIFQNSTDVKLVTSRAYRFDENRTIDIHVPRGGTLREFLFANAAMGSTMFLKKEWEKAGGYDARMRQGYEDWEFYIRLLAKGGRAEVIEEPLFFYRQKSSSLRKKANEKRYELWSYIFKKNRDLYIEHFDLYTDFLLKSLQNKEVDLADKEGMVSLKKLIKRIVKR